MIDHGRGVMREASAQDRLNPLSPLWDFPKYFPTAEKCL